ncbi:putative LRR receptor-like serine/threonine-protein kinase [Drosera capensis]
MTAIARMGLISGFLVQYRQLLNMNLSGTLAPEVGQLPHLQILDFMWNQISGGIPKEIGNISSLELLLLNGNRLSGFLPDELGKLTNLIRLQVDENNISGPIPDLSHNHLNGTIPESFADLPVLQVLSLENNSLIGSIPASIWSDKTFSSAARLTVDLRNNLLTNVSGELAPSVNVTLRLKGNPMCNANILNVHQYCDSDAGGNGTSESSTNSTVACPVQACPTDNYYEYLLAAPEACFCAAPIRVGYRLKSPSFSYFPPYVDDFEVYVTSYLSLDSYVLSIDSYEWEEGPRLRMYLKVFPTISDGNQFNDSEVERIRDIFASWQFPSNDLFGPYELLNFTLLGPYQTATKLSIKIDGVREFTFKELALATNSFNSSAQVGRGGYGRVYKGIISDNTVVAVKRAEVGSLQGRKEFLTEIELLSRLHHRNLVSLVGYCGEAGEQNNLLDM